MAEIPKSIVAIKSFEGMASNFDATDLNPGISQEQVNVNGMAKGKLEVRRGLRALEFEPDEDE